MLTAKAVSNWYVGPASYLARWVIIGATCADTVHEDTSDEIAVWTAMHFLGLNVQCISCHDGRRHLEKVNLWLTEQKRSELWQQAAFFGKTRVLRRTEVSTAQDEYSIDDEGPGYSASGESVQRVPRRGEGMVEPAFLLTGEQPDPNKNPREEFARMITSHPQFARATVNLFWAEMMGVGIVDPVFDFDLLRQDPKNPPPAGWSIQPSHPEATIGTSDGQRDLPARHRRRLGPGPRGGQRQSPDGATGIRRPGAGARSVVAAVLSRISTKRDNRSGRHVPFVTCTE
jgi:hypothetical protein